MCHACAARFRRRLLTELYTLPPTLSLDSINTSRRTTSATSSNLFGA